MFFSGGGGFEPQFPHHIAICSGGGGVQPRFPDHRAIGNRCGIFFCGTPLVRLCLARTGHYMLDGHNAPLAHSQETGISTTYCDATSPAPVEKKRLSALKLPQGEPAKRAANSDAPGTRRGPAIPYSVPQAGKKPSDPSPSHPSSPPALPPLYNSWMSPSVILPSAAVSVSGAPSCSARRSGESGGSSCTRTGVCRTRKTGLLSSRGGPESRHM